MSRGRPDRRWIAPALAVGALVGGLLLVSLVEPPTPRRSPANIVIVLVDTLRADATSLHGYARDTTPFLRELGRHGVRFDRARAQSSCTFPSVNSILSGRSPVHFLGQKPRGRIGLLPDLPTVQEVLRSRGYRTLAVSASTVVRATPSKHNPQGGFGQGFDEFDETCHQARGTCVTKRALQLLPPTGGARRPYFLYLHYLDPHGAYRPPRRLEGRFTENPQPPGPPLRRWVRDGNLEPLVDVLYGDGSPEELTAAELAHVRGLYDEEVLAVDEAVQALVEGLRLRGDWERTLFVLVGDHGEEFLEHGGVQHCRTLWDEVLRTPMLWVGPGLDPGAVDRPVSNLDVMPTLLARLGIDASQLGLEGEDLFGAEPSEPSGGEGGESWSFAIQDRWRSVTGARFKLVFDVKEHRARLFDLEADPRETVDVAEREREALRLHWRALEQHLIATEGGVGSRKTQEAMDETMRQLRALGYL